jgi:MoxR-like ATPase
MEDFNIYKGDGKPIDGQLPTPTSNEKLFTPEHYIADPGLRNAVNVAIALSQPLLLTGEPGTGKTQLAGSIAHELKLGAPLIFHTKSVSTARDMFYTYDSLKHFHAAQVEKSKDIDIMKYIRMEALGTAILRASNDPDAKKILHPPKQESEQSPVDINDKKRSVVLIDEVDKAPRDLPNDLLNELENMAFTIQETGKPFKADPQYKPIVVLTSNSEKNLPEAFLRRCVYYHISFPEESQLKDIVSNRLKLSHQYTEDKISAAIQHFLELRKKNLRKPPATAELLSWINVLDQLKIDFTIPIAEQEDDIKGKIKDSYSVLAKNKEDRDQMHNNL